jgi:hypothetical protein
MQLAALREASARVAYALSILTLCAVLLAPFASAAFAAEQPPTSTTAPDDRYGAGGSKETVTNAERQLIAEIWRDGAGIVREQHELPGGGEEYWGFFFQDGSSSSDWGGSIIAIRPMARPEGRFEMRVYAPGNLTLKEYSFLTKEELMREFTHWHRQMQGWVNGFIRGQQGATPR